MTFILNNNNNKGQNDRLNERSQPWWSKDK